MDNVTYEFTNVQWRKSSFSGHDGSDCVEVVHLSGGRRGVRDSKDRGRPALVVSSVEWVAFLDHLKIDHLA
ncbi:DUF397 domain-containing protein [Sphaerisporangium perillae]|uniref:DUF397 domain-containing protein n=1 Tax=Sphaerisporangium perillae TaxID=2935860 RepID=UPI00200C9441|nr:DUF397 domain-containing protein [Sphaerisporangium perillae]